MKGKREALRQGGVVELEPGVKGRLNFEDKSLELSDGRKLSISEKNRKELFPENEEVKKYAQEKEKIQSGLKNFPGGEFLYQFGSKGVLGGVKDWGNRITMAGDDYLRNKKAQQEVSEQISEESPWTSGAATVASFVPDIALTKGMSATKALPLLHGISAGSRVLDEPLQVAGEAALSSVGGFLLDKGGQALSRVAQRRGQSRAIPRAQQAVNEQNIAGEQLVNARNIQQRQEYQALKDRVGNENAALTHQYNLKLNARENEMIKAKNALEQGKISQEEYKIAQKSYQESLKDLPKLQQEAQKKFGSNVVNAVKEIEKKFPGDSKIFISELSPNGFVEESINSGGFAGTKEAKEASGIIQSIFNENEVISGSQLTKKYKALEDAIQRSNPEVQQMLVEFKDHLANKLPLILEDNLAHSKIIPSFVKNVKTKVSQILKSVKLDDLNKFDVSIKDQIIKNLDKSLKNIDSKNFIERFESGQLLKEITEDIFSLEKFIPGLKKEDIARILNPVTKNDNSLAASLKGKIEKAMQSQKILSEELTDKLGVKIPIYEKRSLDSTKEAYRRLGEKLKGTKGKAETVPSPKPPENPPPMAQFQTPEMPMRPQMAPEPNIPIPETFTPQATPQLSPAQTISEHAGDFLERGILGSKNSVLTNALGPIGKVLDPIAKLTGLKYLLGGAAAPIETGYLSLKGLTSPTAGGAAARMTFKQAGIEAIENMAKKYPSYSNGIVQNPMERRSLTKEIEDDNEIPLEEKAIMQSKINRGKSLNSEL